MKLVPVRYEKQKEKTLKIYIFKEKVSNKNPDTNWRNPNFSGSRYASMFGSNALKNIPIIVGTLRLS